VAHQTLTWYINRSLGTSNAHVHQVGMATTDDRIKDPALWAGTNVLGWALMRARGSLGGTGVPDAKVA
jgi:hypothetical protein